jgi:hypothetical protein
MIKIDFAPDPRILRQFAYVAVVGLPLLTGLVLRMFGAFAWTHPAFLVAGGLGILQLGVFAAGVTSLTRWLFVGLSLVALPIGFVISQVLMAVIYYLVMTPIGLVFRLIGRDVLGRKIDRQRASYWHDRGPQRAPSSYFKLY